MQISNLWLRLDAIRKNGEIYFSAFVCSGPRNEFVVEPTCNFICEVGVLGNFTGRRKIVRSEAGRFQVTCTSPNFSSGWAIVKVRQTPDAIQENFGITLENNVYKNDITVSLEPFPSSLHALSYVASYADLIFSFGDDERAARSHYREKGRREHRSILFRPYDYAASHQDLFHLVSDPIEAARHYIKIGHTEGRPTYFDAYLYGAGYSDLALQFGPDPAALSLHYVNYGFAEGRNCERFDWKRYAATVPGIQRSASTVAKHYLQSVRH